MILVDTSIWIDHIHAPIDTLESLLFEQRIVHHPYVSIEIGLGQFATRTAFLNALGNLACVPVPDTQALLEFIDEANLANSGVGFVNLSLLHGARTAAARLWTRDKRLKAQAVRLGLAFEPE